MPEVVGNYMETGYVVKSRDPYSLAEAIEYLLLNPEERKKMWKAARKRITEVFTWENAAREMEKVYREVIDAYSGF